MPEETFVGRERYIQRFRQLLVNPLGKPYISNLCGPGGIGKTKILQKFIEICQEEGYPNTGIIDFYASELNTQINQVELTIAKTVSETLENGPFARYWQVRQEAEEALQKEAENYRVLREKSKNQFIADLANWAEACAAKGKKWVLIFDTFEAVLNNQVGARLLNEWLPVLKSATAILSGRQKLGQIAFPVEVADLVAEASVDAFTREEAIAYLKERQVWGDIERDNVANRLFELTAQQPLRLALSADRLTRYNFLNPMTPEKLVEGIEQADFERKLVEDLINDMEYPESTVLPAMAHVPRPFDAELIEFLFPDNIDDPTTILKNLGELSFIKEIEEEGNKRYWFQDELRTLFHKYIFDQYSHTWNPFRRDTSKKMLAFYESKIAAVEAEDRMAKERLTADSFYHNIYLNPEKKFAEAHEKFQQFRERHQIRYSGMVLGAIRAASAFLSAEQKFSLRLMEARSLRDNGYPQASEHELQILLDEYGQNPERALYIHNAFGGTTELLGKLSESLEHHRRSLELREMSGQLDQCDIDERNIGRIYRKMGYWETAIDHLQRAYDLAVEYRVGKMRAANILSDLGYVLGLHGESQAALEHCNEAIRIWEGLNVPQAVDYSQRIAYGKVIRGAVHRMAGHYQEARQDLKEAIANLYTSEHAVLAQAYSDLGFTQWSQAKEMNNLEFLVEAQQSLEKGLTIARTHNLVQELPRLLRRIGHVFWDQGKHLEKQGQQEQAERKKKVAHERTQEGLELGRQYNVHFAINCLVGLAEFDYEDHVYDTIPGYAQKLKAEFEDKGYQFPLFYGRMCRILGDVAFHKKNYQAAVSYYTEALHLISQHGGYGPYSVESEVSRLEDKLRSLPGDIALASCQDLKKRLMDKELDKSRPEMISWLNRLIGELVFQN